MSLKNDIPVLIEQYKKLQPFLAHNQDLFNIYEGELLPYILEDLKKQLSEKSYEQIKHRVPPINILIKLIDKLSKIYAKPPSRAVKDGNETDQAIVDWYLEQMDLNTYMTIANEFFNLFKACAVEPYLENGIPKVRIVPADRFFVYSNDPVNPTKPTHYVKCMGKINVGTEQRNLFFGYTDTEFLPFDDKGEVVTGILQKYDNANGVNIYGKIPAVYINRSRHNLIPKSDTDTIAMTKLLPVLLADANFANMFQSFSIIYGIDVDDQDIKMAPNAFWRFKSDPTKETKPHVGVIKPEVDTDKTLNLIKTLVSLWMQTRNIKPGAMGNMTVESAASGISKVIDEMDTSEDRQKQVSYFVSAEGELWDLIINNMHPVWMRERDFKERRAFSPKASVTVAFPDQKPIVDPGVVVDNEIKKLRDGIQSRRGAIKAINPDLDDKQIDALLAEISRELTVEVQTDDGEGNQGSGDPMEGNAA